MGGPAWMAAMRMLALAMLLFHGVAGFQPLGSAGRMRILHQRIEPIQRSSTRVYLFDRIWRLISSNVLSWVKRMEDPEKIIEQSVLDMQNDLVRIRQSYAEVSATQKRMEVQLQSASAAAEEWYARAGAAMQSGRDDLAQEALRRRKLQLEAAAGLQKQISMQADSISKLFSSMQALESKILEAKRQKESFVARARTAKASLRVNDLLSNMQTSSSVEAFERMKERVESLEVQAEVAGEFSASAGTTSLEERFRELESSDVDDDMAQLRRKLSIETSSSALQRLPSNIGQEQFIVEGER